MFPPDWSNRGACVDGDEGKSHPYVKHHNILLPYNFCTIAASVVFPEAHRPSIAISMGRILRFALTLRNRVVSAFALDVVDAASLYMFSSDNGMFHFSVHGNQTGSLEQKHDGRDENQLQHNTGNGIEKCTAQKHFPGK